jgi:nicotinate-nucleotide adenylyltransferase
MNGILFGGAFDPPHLGHIQMAEEAHKLFPARKILVMPSPVSPTPGKSDLTSFEHRLAMAKIAFETPLQKGWLEVSTLEKDLPSPNYTIATLRALNTDAGERLILMIGEDQLSHFHLWKEPIKILEMTDLIVFQRLEKSATVSDLGAHLGLSTERTGDSTYQIGPARVVFVHDRVCKASSRELRARLSLGEDSPWLPQHVKNYIKENQLYGTP